MSKLDDLFGKKKEVIPVLDLSKSTANSKEEFKRLLEKVPDYKMRPIKVRQEEIKLKERDYTFKPPKKESKLLLKRNGEREKLYSYLDPVPTEMRPVVIMELCPVPIDWKMLTTLRPKTKMEEQYFSKLVEIGKLQLKTEARDKRECTLQSSIRKVKNKSGVVETRIFSCPECSEEFCNGQSCSDFNYDCYTRITPKVVQKPKIDGQQTAAAGKIVAGIGGNSRKKLKGTDKQQKKKSSPKKRARSKSPSKKGEKSS